MKKASILALAFLFILPGVLAPFKQIKAAPCTDDDNTIDASCEFAPDTYYYDGTLTIEEGVTVTVGSQSSPGIVYIYADNIIVNGTISANAMGSAGGSGTCPGSSGTTGGGGCHAGFGGRSSGNVAGGSNAYGFAEVPTNVGSGGGDDTDIGSQQGGRGGGALWLGTYSATGTLSFGTLGAITANGENGTSGQAGGGAGGTVYIDVGIIDVQDGIIQANGGNGAGSGTTGGGGGGGGMVAIRYNDTTGIFTQSRQAFGGNRGTTTNIAAQPGAPGTIYTKDLDDSIEALTVRNDKSDPPFTRTEMVNSVNDFNLLAGARMLIDDQLEVDDTFTYTALANNAPELWIRNGYFQTPDEAMTFSGLNIHQTGLFTGLKYMTFDNGVYSVDPSSALFSGNPGNRLSSLVLSGTGTTTFSATGTGTFYVDLFQAKSNSYVTHATNTTATTHSLSISATTSLAIDSGASVNVVGRGFNGLTGPGAGTTCAFDACGGGSHGGNGGTGSFGTPGLTAYGSVREPSTLGSGGGGAGGGKGGGIIKLVSGGALTVAGTVTANGNTGSSGVNGGGAGGSVWIDADALTVSGTITASGAVGGTGSGHSTGGGGGGRLAIYYNTDSGGGTRGAFGGSGVVGGTPGGAGSYFLDDKDDALANGTLIIDGNNFSNSRNTQQICTPDCVQTYDVVSVTKGARYVINAYTTLAIASGGALTGGGTQQASITINAGGAFTPVGTTSFAFDDVDIVAAGTVNTVTDLTVSNASFTESGTGTFAAGVTDLVLNTATYTKATGYSGLDLTNLNVPSGSTFNNNSSAYYPFLSTFDTLTVYGTFSQGTTTRLFLDELVVQNGGTMTHAAQVGGTQTVGLDISATTSVYVHVGGTISTAGRGFPTATGPGAASTCSFGACRGGAHAGAGGLGSFGSGGTTMYGSVTEPTTLGSGGGNDTGIVAGLGGGAIKLVAPTLIAAGSITSNGTNGPSAGGGGAGGSLWIDVTTLTGGGSITANGGNGGTASGQSTGGGGGGRVAIYYVTDSGTGTRSALSGVDGVNGTSGGAGTLFIDDKDDALANGSLTVDANNLTNAGNTQQGCSPDCVQTYDAITIRRGANYVISAYTTLALASGGTLTTGGTTRPDITVNAGGTFDPGQASFSYNALNLLVSGTVASATSLALNEAGLTLSGTGTFANPVTTLNINGFSSFTQGSVTPNLALTNLDVPTLGSVNVTANAYYPFGEGFATLNVTGTYTNSTLHTLFLDALNVNQGGLVTHATQTGSTQTIELEISATSTITVASGGSISVQGKGYGASTGTGSATSCAFGACRGASHAGFGGVGSFGSGGTTVYGSVTQPILHGSGGGGDSGGGNIAGNGGGTLKLTSSGTLTVVGTVSARGGNSTSSSGGGGSGGSLWIDVDALAGGGTISAGGGTAGTASGQSTGGGGGGRMALYYNTDSSTATLSVAGGTDGGNGTIGGGGSIFLDDKDDALANGTLRVDNGNQTNDSATQQAVGTQTYDVIDIRSGAEYTVPSGATLAVTSGGTITGGGTVKGTLTIASGGVLDGGSLTASATGLNITNNGTLSTTTAFTYGNGTFLNNGTFSAGLVSLTVGSGANWRQQISSQLFSGSDLTIESGGTFTQEHTNVIEVDTVTIESGGTLTHCDNTTTKTCEVDFSSTTFTVESGGTINVDAKGFDSTTGDGQGGDANAGGGAGYGGNGGDGVVSSVNQNNNGVLYGSATGPVDLGSGGGDDTGATNQQGGAGGGVIRLLISGTLTVDGAISADGQGGTANEGGGGSGGSIWLTVDALNATANIGADGGAGSGNNTTGGGCGAGGRVAIDYGTYSQSATTTSSAGTGCTGVRVASTGSVYLNELPADAPTIDGIMHVPAAPNTVDNVTISASATYATGLDKIELYLDGTTLAHLRHTCDFTSATSGECSITVGQLSRGTHTTTVKAYGDDASVAEEAESFTVAGFTVENTPMLERSQVSVTTVFNLEFEIVGSATGTFTVTFPGGFTVNSAFTGGSSCLSNFGFTASTLTATKTGCSGTITATGASVTNPGTPGLYEITWTNDDSGSGGVYITDSDQATVEATVAPTLSFNVGVQTGTCDGTFTGAGGTLAFGSLTASAVATSDVASVPHICTRLTTNAAFGTAVTVRSENGALRSTSNPSHQIPSSTATLTAGTEGYGLCVGSGGGDTGVDITVPAGATPVAAGPYGGTCATGDHQVGALTTAGEAVWTLSGPAQNAFARLFLKAAVSPTTNAHNDYADTLTFIATGRY